MKVFFFWSIIKPAIETMLLAFCYYRILVFFQGTRAFQVLMGMFYVLVIFLLAQFLGLDIINWLLTKFLTISIIALVIIFQQELRHGLARIGQGHLFSLFLEESEVEEVIDEIVDACYKMSNKRIGCLLGIEREAKLKIYIESGIQLDAIITSELLQTIFRHESPIHDGGVIIRGQRLVAAACLLPLSENQNLSKIIGTRHRAALGLTEQTDAVTVMVSEESGEISIANDGRFIPVTGPDRLRDVLKDLLITRPAAVKKGKK